MRVYYDLHMHSCLSPCAEDEMTPNNMVNMSMIKGLDVIAVTDHNTVKNCGAAMEVGKKRDIVVIPGMELQTVEDVHLVCLFKGLEDAISFEKIVKEKSLNIPNRPEKFGKQLILDKEDNIVGEEQYLLITSVSMTVEEAFEAVRKMGGIIFPAHIDRSSNSIVSNLGFIPDDLDVKLVEISTNPSRDKILNNDKFKKYKVITNSDAHMLEKISERVNYIEVDERTIEGVFRSLLKEERE